MERMSAEDVRFILENALRAPSGDNTQPWRWVVRGNVFELWNESSDEPLHTLYSSSQDNSQASHLSFGAAIENAVIAATVRNYRTDVFYFPNPVQSLLVARLVFVIDSAITADSLGQTLSKRVTNRKTYRRKPLQPEERARLIGSSPHEGSEGIRLIDDRASVNELAAIASLHDELIFSTKGLHHYVFAHINWTKREDARRRIGFYFPTLAAPPCTWGFMQIIRHWWVMRIGIALGLHRVIALEQQFVYRQSGAYGIVLTKGDTPTDWIEAGRQVERLWLTATSMGLSVHPLNGTLLLALSLNTEAGQHFFSLQQQDRLREGRRKIASLFSVEDKKIAFMFRIGHGKPPAARTSRLPLEKVVTFAS